MRAKADRRLWLLGVVAVGVLVGLVAGGAYVRQMWKLQDDTGAVAEAIAGVEAISVDRVEWTCDGYSLALIGSAGESRLEVLDRLEVALTDLSFERNGLYRFERDRDDAFDADLVLVSPEQQGQRIDLAVTVADGDSLRCLPGWLAGDLDVLGETPRR